jgi:hypothetical protein
MAIKYTNIYPNFDFWFEKIYHLATLPGSTGNKIRQEWNVEFN